MTKSVSTLFCLLLAVSSVLAFGDDGLYVYSGKSKAVGSVQVSKNSNQGTGTGNGNIDVVAVLIKTIRQMNNEILGQCYDSTVLLDIVYKTRDFMGFYLYPNQTCPIFRTMAIRFIQGHEPEEIFMEAILNGTGLLTPAQKAPLRQVVANITEDCGNVIDYLTILIDTFAAFANDGVQHITAIAGFQKYRVTEASIDSVLVAMNEAFTPEYMQKVVSAMDVRVTGPFHKCMFEDVAPLFDVEYNIRNYRQ